MTSDEKNKPDEAHENHEEKEEKHSGLLEKIFTVFSLLLLATLSVYLVYRSFAPDSPPSFKVELGLTEKRGDFQGIEVTVVNIGDDAARSVQVIGEAIGADGNPVESQATLDWLPGDSKRKVTLIFPADANTTTAEVRVAGYEEP